MTLLWTVARMHAFVHGLLHYWAHALYFCSHLSVVSPSARIGYTKHKALQIYAWGARTLAHAPPRWLSMPCRLVLLYETLTLHTPGTPRGPPEAVQLLLLRPGPVRGRMVRWCQEPLGPQRAMHELMHSVLLGCYSRTLVIANLVRASNARTANKLPMFQRPNVPGS